MDIVDYTYFQQENLKKTIDINRLRHIIKNDRISLFTLYWNYIIYTNIKNMTYSWSFKGFDREYKN